jgi:hypothetical protein
VQPPIAFRPMHMRRFIGVTRVTVTESISVPIRGFHVSLSGERATASVKCTSDPTPSRDATLSNSYCIMVSYFASAGYSEREGKKGKDRALE